MARAKRYDVFNFMALYGIAVIGSPQFSYHHPAYTRGAETSKHSWVQGRTNGLGDGQDPTKPPPNKTLFSLSSMPLARCSEISLMTVHWRLFGAHSMHVCVLASAFHDHASCIGNVCVCTHVVLFLQHLHKVPSLRDFE
jgi:hypothetical protein